MEVLVGVEVLTTVGDWVFVDPGALVGEEDFTVVGVEDLAGVEVFVVEAFVVEVFVVEDLAGVEVFVVEALVVEVFVGVAVFVVEGEDGACDAAFWATGQGFFTCNVVVATGCAVCIVHQTPPAPNTRMPVPARRRSVIFVIINPFSHPTLFSRFTGPPRALLPPETGRLQPGQTPPARSAASSSWATPVSAASAG